MKIVHLADTHLGYHAFSSKLDPDRNINQRECDVYTTWHEAVDKAIELAPDALIHAGDLFDSSRPAPRALAEALDGFARLREANIPVIVIAGNHETPRFRSSGSIFEILERFGVQAVWREPETVLVGGLAIHAVPHEPSAAQLTRDIDSLKPSSKAESNVLVLHAGIEALPRQGYGEVNEIELEPGVLIELEYDYIAMGHLHQYRAPQVNAAYPGSLERLGFYDLEEKKAVLEIDLAAGAGAKGFVSRHSVSARPLFDLTLLCGGLGPAEILKEIEKAAQAHPLEGAVLRVRLEQITRDVYQVLDFLGIGEVFTECLHYELQVGRSGLAASSTEIPAEIPFDLFAREHIPKGADLEAVIKLANRYLNDAAHEEAEEATG